MKKITSTFLALSLLVGVLALVGCGSSAPKDGKYTRITLDVNPSIEFMVDDENKVVSVTALNDDGAVLIAGEAFVGKTPEEAIELALTVATETGYLVKGDATVDENTVTVSVSGNSRYSKQLMSTIEEKIDSTLEGLDVEGRVERAKALGLEALRELAGECSAYTEEELAKMDADKLHAVIAESRIDTALLLTSELREVYIKAKEHRISFAKSEATAVVIEGLGDLYTITQEAYSAALQLYGLAIDALDALRYSTLADPDSPYQKTLTALRDSKSELVAQRAHLASLDADSAEYAAAESALALAEESYGKALAAFTELGNTANEAFLALINRLEEAETKLKQIESKMFDDKIKETLAEKAEYLEESINKAKDAFFEEFENEHKDDIRRIEAALLDKKQELKDKISENK